MNLEAERRKHETKHVTVEIQRKKIVDEIIQIPTLFPWTKIHVGDTALCHEHNTSWNEPLREALIADISKIYVRLMKQMNILNAHSIIHNAANLTRLHGQLLVEVNRRIDVQAVLARVKAKKAEDALDIPISIELSRWKTVANIIPLISPSKPVAQAKKNSPKNQKHASKQSKSPKSHALSSRLFDSPPKTKEVDEKRRRTIQGNQPTIVALTHQPLTLRELLLDADDDVNSVTHFRDRPMLAEAMIDITKPVSKREPKKPRARYLMSSNCTALPHEHSIFDDYVIPREVWDAVEEEQKRCVNATGLPQLNFDPIEVEAKVSCYFARACPTERDTLSSSLQAMKIQPEKPVARNVTDLVLDSQFHEKNNTLLLREVKMLYAATNSLYHDFRQTLHRPMKVAELVDMAVKCALNDMSIAFNDAVVSTEAMIQIPPHLVPQASLRRNGGSPTKNASFPSRESDSAMKLDRSQILSRRDVMEQLQVFDGDRQLLSLWKQKGVAPEYRPFDPIALDAPLSVKFENVWRGLHMSSALRLDLALKYSHPEYAHRLADAVLLWEVCAIWIQEREIIIDQLKRQLKGGVNDLGRMALLDLKEKLSGLVIVTTKVKECIQLTYSEVNDFVTYEEEFYLVRIQEQHRRFLDELMSNTTWREME